MTLADRVRAKPSFWDRIVSIFKKSQFEVDREQALNTDKEEMEHLVRKFRESKDALAKLEKTLK